MNVVTLEGSTLVSIQSVNIVTERINGQLITYALTAKNDQRTLADETQKQSIPTKPVELITNTPPTVVAPVVNGTLEELKKRAKELHIKGAHLFKDAAKLAAAIQARTNGGQPTQPAAAVPTQATPQKRSSVVEAPAPQAAAAPTEPAKKKGFGKRDNSPVAIKGLRVLEVYKKDRSKVFEVIELETGLTMGADTTYAGCAGQPGTLVMMEDTKASEHLKDGYVTGSRWKLPNSFIVRVMGVCK